MNINRYSFIWSLLLIGGLSTDVSSQTRSYDGFGNNESNPEWGAAGTELRSVVSKAFSDGIAVPNGMERPNPRKISNDLFDQISPIYDLHNLTDYVWVFGQFIDHDIGLVGDSPTEANFVVVPPCDPIFDPACIGATMIPMMRSKALPGTGVTKENPRSYANEISAFLDGSAVYGSDEARANWLRSKEDGKLKMSEGGLLPFNTLTGELNGPTDPLAPEMMTGNESQNRYFVAGDVRANENVMLTSMHTLFVREHNRICDRIKKQNPAAQDEEIFQRARKIVGGILQNVTYSEWLPSMGVILDEYAGYRPDINPNVSNVFTAAAFRYGHTLLSSNLLRMTDDCKDAAQGNLQLRGAFFNPELVLASGIDPLVKGMSAQIQQDLDCKVIDAVRNFLFGPPGMGFGMDLAAININRGRERGLPDYNTIRDELGLGRVRTFEEICIDPVEAQILRDLYGTVDQVDPWVGMLAEEHMPGAMFGETIMTIMKDQFKALRDGDRFYFENDPELTSEDINMIRQTGLADLVKRNTSLQAMQENVFVMERKCHSVDIEKRHLALSVYPNPVENTLNAHIYSFATDDADLILYDHIGREVYRLVLPLDEGVNSISINLSSNVPTGIYNLHIRHGERINTTKILKID